MQQLRKVMALFIFSRMAEENSDIVYLTIPETLNKKSKHISYRCNILATQSDSQLDVLNSGSYS
jgi:hypothetical protein